MVFAKRTEAFTYAVASRGFEKLVDKINEVEKTGGPSGQGYLEMGKEYRPPEDFQSEVVTGKFDGVTKTDGETK